MGGRGRIHVLLIDGLKGKRRYWKLNEEALDCSLSRTRFGREYGHVERHSVE